MKWTETRSEGYRATIHGRDLIQHGEITATRDGQVLGLKVDLVANMGAYLQLLTPSIPLLGRYMYPAIYKFDAHTLYLRRRLHEHDSDGRVSRGAGRPEATFVIERLMDDLAAELDMDPMELRRRNWINKDEFPYETVAGLTYDSGDYEAATSKAEELFDYAGLRREQQERRQRKDPVQLGIGISTYTEMAGLAPSRWLGETGYVAGGWEAATVRCCPQDERKSSRDVAPRSGARDDVRPGGLRRAGHPLRRHRRHLRRHRARATGARHVRIAVAAGRWCRRLTSSAARRGEGARRRRSPPRGGSERRRVR